nr:hypothetical protein [Tanacetum cinerariifolium]
MVGEITNQNPNGNGNVIAAQAEGNTTANNGNQISCYNCRGLAGLDEIKEVNANCILMDNLQQASTSGTQTDKASVYDSDGSVEVIVVVGLWLFHVVVQLLVHRPPFDCTSRNHTTECNLLYASPFLDEQCLTIVNNSIDVFRKTEKNSMNELIIGFNLFKFLSFINDVSARAKKPYVVPISTGKPTRKANHSVATPHKKTISSKSTIKKSKSYFRMLYEKTSKTWTWWIEKTMFISTVRFGNDQFALIIGYEDLVQGNVMVKRVYYVEGLNLNLFSVGTHGFDLHIIALQESSSPIPICFMAKASSTQEWLWNRRLSHLNFDTINLLSKNVILNDLPKLKSVNVTPSFLQI